MGGGLDTARKRAVFLCALERSGSVALAATEASIDRGTAYNWRRRDPEFARAWDAAKAHAQAMLADAAAPLMLGEGQAVWGGDTQHPRTTRIADTSKRWTRKAERSFLGVLAGNCNVRAAAAAAGFSTTSAYARRLRSAAFRADWDEALEEGWARLAAKLMRQAAYGIERGVDDVPARIADADEDRAIEDTALALNLLKQHEAAGRGRGGAGAGEAGGGARAGARGGGAGAETTIEAVHEKILVRIAGLRRARSRAEGLLSGAGAEGSGLAHPRPLPHAGGEKEGGVLPPAGGEKDDRALPQAGGGK